MGGLLMGGPFTDTDIFIPPSYIKEVCIRREDEGIFYFCPRHDPESIRI
jgi:hypothetical protein